VLHSKTGTSAGGGGTGISVGGEKQVVLTVDGNTAHVEAVIPVAEVDLTDPLMSRRLADAGAGR